VEKLKREQEPIHINHNKTIQEIPIYRSLRITAKLLIQMIEQENHMDHHGNKKEVNLNDATVI
jgi:hypothetical protein